MEGSEKQKAEDYLASYLRAGQEVKTEAQQAAVSHIEAAKAAVVEAISAASGSATIEVSPAAAVVPKVEIPTIRDLDKILGKVEVAPIPKIEETPADDGAVIINERIIEAPVMPAAPQPEMMEQPQQPWMGKDRRAGSGNEGKDFPSRRKEAERWAKVIDGTVRDVAPVELPTIAQQPQSEPVEVSPMVEAPVPVPSAEQAATAPQAAVESSVKTEVPLAVAPVLEVVPEPVLPKQEKMVPVPTPDVDPTSSVDVKVVSKISDGEVKGWTLTAEKKPEAAPPIISPEVAPAAMPEMSTASDLSPEAVEAALRKGEKVSVPEVVAPAPVSVVEVPKENPSVSEAKIPREKDIVEPAKVEIKHGKKNIHEQVAKVVNSIELQEKFHVLSTSGKSLVRSLYTSQPANAVRALGWRMSIGFNDKIANYFGEKALISGSRRELNEAELVQVGKKQKEEADELTHLSERFNGVALTAEVAKQAEKEHAVHEREAKGFRSGAEGAAREEQKHKSKESLFIEQRNKAAEKLASYVQERLTPFESKIELLRTTKEKLDAEMGDFQGKCDQLQIERDRVYAEIARMNMANKPQSLRMAYQEVARRHDENLVLAQEVLESRLVRRSALELQLGEVNAKADKIRPALQEIQDIPNKIRTSARPKGKVELAPEPVDAVPSVAEEMEKDELELTLVRHEAIPDMTPTEFMESWNTFAGGDIPMNVDEFAAFMGVDKNKEVAAMDLLRALEGRFDAMLADKRKKRLRVDRDVILKNMKAFKNIYLRLRHATS